MTDDPRLGAEIHWIVPDPEDPVDDGATICWFGDGWRFSLHFGAEPCWTLVSKTDRENLGCCGDLSPEVLARLAGFARDSTVDRDPARP